MWRGRCCPLGTVGSLWYLLSDTLAPQGRGRLGDEWAHMTGRQPLSLSSVPSRVSPALSRGDGGEEAEHPAFPTSLLSSLQGHSSRRGGPAGPALASGCRGSLCPPAAGRWATPRLRVASLLSHCLCSGVASASLRWEYLGRFLFPGPSLG